MGRYTGERKAEYRPIAGRCKRHVQTRVLEAASGQNVWETGETDDRTRYRR